MGKISSLSFLLLFLTFNLFTGSVFAREVIEEKEDQLIVRLSRVYFKGNENSVPTYLPLLKNIYSCDGILIRKPLAEYTSTTLRTSYNLHGNRDYYALRGIPMENVRNLKGSFIGTALESIEYLGAKSSSGIQNTYGFWWGIDTKPNCGDNSVYSPLTGKLYGDVDRSYGSGGYERNIIGEGIFSGYAVKVLHLSSLDTVGLKFVPVSLNEKLSNVSNYYKHNHVTVMFGTGLGKADVPYTYLLAPEIITEIYIVGGTEGSTPMDSIIEKYLEIRKYEPNVVLNGFEKLKLEETYRYLSSKTTKKIVLDIGYNSSVYVNFNERGEFTGIYELETDTTTSPVLGQTPTPTSEDDGIRKYKFLGNIYMYHAKLSGETYVKNGANGKFCTPVNNSVGVYGKRIDSGLLIYSNDKKTIMGICSWYEYLMKEM